ncbi:MAG TPA: GNAT family N-acetyltransferase [Candidatus Saccharimonadales bacterium]|nr:GNAT family N-acetyltransferase [Candidatus Saccharimonadales bacterium]
MTSNNRSVEIISYPNPCSDRLYDDVDQSEVFHFIADENKARDKAGLSDYFLDEAHDNVFEGPGEYFQRKYPGSIVRVPAIDEWYETVTTWMPPDVENWWLEQFKTNEHLDSMPQEWWRQRTRNLFIAREKDGGNKLVGSLALTLVHLDERDLVPSRRGHLDSPIFFEPRVLVVDQARRGEHIAQKLMQAALDAATMSDIYVPTAAVTTNTAAAKLFKKMKATTQPSDSEGYTYGGFGGERYNEMACWSRYDAERGQMYGRWACSGTIPSSCDACPKYANTAWWWPTHSEKLMNELGIPEAA